MDILTNGLQKYITVDIGDLVVNILFYESVKSGNANVSAPHFHGSMEFQYACDADFYIKTNRNSYRVEKYHYSLIPQKLFHWCGEKKENFRRFSFIFFISCSDKNPRPSENFSEYKYYADLLNRVDRIFINNNDDVRKYVEKIISLCKDYSESNEHKLKLYFSMLFLCIADDISDRLKISVKQAADDVPHKSDMIVMRNIIAEYVSTNYANDGVSASISQMLHMSERHTSRLIKELFGMSLSKLITNQRMNCAEMLINQTDISLEKISEMVGYNSYNTFYKMFKKHFACAPETLRED